MGSLTLILIDVWALASLGNSKHSLFFFDQFLSLHSSLLPFVCVPVLFLFFLASYKEIFIFIICF